MTGKATYFMFILAAGLLVSRGSAEKKSGPVDLALTDIEGRKVRLSEYRGRVVVVNFWATWCGPCREEMPMLVEASKVWGAKGVAFIGASLDEKQSRPEIPAFLTKYHVDFPVWTGASIRDVGRLGLGGAVPDTLFLNEEGVVFARAKGEIRRKDLDERLEWITGNRSRPAPKPMISSL